MPSKALVGAVHSLPFTFMPHYQHQAETCNAIESARHEGSSLSFASMHNGSINKEPVIIMVDSLIRYAKAYKKRFEGPIAHDYILGVAWEQALEAVRTLLNGEGAVQMEGGGPSFDGGTMDRLINQARTLAGFSQAD